MSEPDTNDLLQKLLANQQLMQDAMAQLQASNAEKDGQIKALMQQLGQGAVADPSPQPAPRTLTKLAVQALGNEEGNVHYKALRVSKDEDWRLMESEGGRLG